MDPKDERLLLLEQRNERLFRMLGHLDYMVQHEPDSRFTVELVKELLEGIAYGKEVESYVSET